MQHTIATKISGKGYGKNRTEIRYTINPAPVNTGIRIVRTGAFPAEIFNTANTLSRQLDRNVGEFLLSSINPLLVVLGSLGIDNVEVTVDGSEIPVMDHCLEAIVFLVQAAGKSQQLLPRKFIQLRKPLVVSEKGKWIRLIPGSRLRFACLDSGFRQAFPFHHFGSLMEFSETRFVTEICRARPFETIKEEWRNLQSQGLPPQVTENKVQKLMDEFNNRESLLSLNTLAVFGKPFCADYVSFNADHELRQKLLSTLIKYSSLYLTTYIEVESDQPQNDLNSRQEAVGC